MSDDWGLDETRTSHGEEPGTMRYSDDERSALAAKVWAAYAPPPRIGPYRIGERLGRGGMARVHLGVDPHTGRRVAIKLLAPSPGLEEDPEGVARFAREAEALAKLSTHPGIVTIESAGQTKSGLPYLIMELVDGPTLNKALREGLPRETALDHLETVAEALAHAHQHGILHRDVKPANILLAADGARLADFGLARLIQSDRRLTQTGDVLGTPAYMAPEQASPELGQLGPWTDVWALGIVLHEVLVGHPPFRGSSYEIFSKLVTGQPIAATRSAPGERQSALDTLCARVLAREPSERLPDAAAFLRELRTARASSHRPRSRVPGWVPALAALLLAALGGGGVVAALLRRPARAPTTVTPAGGSRLDELATRWTTHDTVAARELLRIDDSVAARPWILAFTGDARLALDDELPPAERARVAAWAGDAGAAEAALQAVSPARASVLRWQLRGLVPLQPERDPGTDPARGGWANLERAARAEGTGRPELAEPALAGLLDSDEPALRLEAHLGLARLAITRGEGRLAAGHLAKALGSADAPLDRARVVALGAVAEAAWGEPLPALVDALGESAQAHARRYAPAVPLASLALETGQPELPADGWPAMSRARHAARSNAQAGLTSLGAQGDSFVAAELASCARGEDGLPGLLIARACSLGEQAERGADREGAQRALTLAQAATRLRPTSPAARSAWTRALRVLRRPDALAHAKAALALAPGDGLLLLELARARLSAVEPKLQTWTPGATEGESRQLLASLEQVAHAFEQPSGDPARLGLLATLAWRYRLLAQLGHDATAALAELEGIRQGLLAEAPLDDLLTARRELAAALDRDPARIPAAEQRLSRLASRFSPTARAAVRLGSVGPSGPRLLRAQLALSADVPGRVLLALRRAEFGVEDGLARARALGSKSALVQAWLVDQRLAESGVEVLRRAPVLSALVKAMALDPQLVGLALSGVSQLSLGGDAQRRLDAELRDALVEPGLRPLSRLLLLTAATPHGLDGGRDDGRESVARLACELGSRLVHERPGWSAPRLLLAAALAGWARAQGAGGSREALWQLALVQAASPRDPLARLWSRRLDPDPTPQPPLGLLAQGYLRPSRRLAGDADWVPTPEAARWALDDPSYEAMYSLLASLESHPDGWALSLTLRMAATDYWGDTFEALPSPERAPRAELAALREAGQAWGALATVSEDLLPESAARLFAAGARASFGSVPGGRLDRWGAAPALRWTGLARSETMRAQQSDLPRLREAWLRLHEAGPALALAHQGWTASLRVTAAPIFSQVDQDSLWGVGRSLAASPCQPLLLDQATLALQAATAWEELALHYDRLAAVRPGENLLQAAFQTAQEARTAAFNVEGAAPRDRFLAHGLAFVRRLRAQGVVGRPLTAQALDMCLDRVGFAETSAERHRWLQRARVELRRAAANPGEIPYELPSETVWRLVRAFVALGEVERALTALELVERAIADEGLPAPGEGVRWAVSGDPLRPELDAVPQVQRFLLRLEE